LYLFRERPEEGREEGIEVVARNMLQSGMGVGWIAKMTGFSEERVELLAQSINA
jgi:predicted transposase YdaD